MLGRAQQRSYGYVHVPKKRPPHLLGFGSEWRKCFVVHPHSQSPRPLEAYLWLSGSEVVEGLPENLPAAEGGAEELALWEERLEAAAAEQGPKGVEGAGQLLSSALLGLWMGGAEHLRTGSLTRGPRVESYWRCAGTNYLSITHPLFILNCTRPLPLFTDPAHCQDPLPPVVEHPCYIGLFEHSFDQITPFPGCHRYSPTAFAHTIFSADLRARSQEQLLAHGLLQLFTQSCAECVQNGYPFDQDLTHPLSLQGVLTNDHQLTFLAFQLNTLDIGGRGPGRRNVLWVGPTLELYSGGRVNRECSELLWRFLMHTPDRERPSHSGFGLKTLALA